MKLFHTVIAFSIFGATLASPDIGYAADKQSLSGSSTKKIIQTSPAQTIKQPLNSDITKKTIKKSPAAQGITPTNSLGSTKKTIKVSPAAQGIKPVLNSGSTKKAINISPNPAPGINTRTIRKIPQTAQANLRLRTVSTPQVIQVRRVMQQGRGLTPEVELKFNVEVTNRGDAEGHYKIVTIIPGSPREHNSKPLRVSKGENQRTTINIHSQFQLPSGSRRLPVTVKVSNLSGRKIAQRIAYIDIPELPNTRNNQRLAGGILSSQSSQPTADLGVTFNRVVIMRPMDGLAATAGAITNTLHGRTTAHVTIKNTGTERWGYPGTLNVGYSIGRLGGQQTRLNGMSGGRADLPRGLQPGESRNVELMMPRRLAGGYYYVATIHIYSDSDKSASNNKAQIEFFVEENGDVTRARGASRAFGGGRGMAR